MGVLNDVMDSAKDVAGTVGKTAGQMLNLSKLKLKSVQLNSNLRSFYEKLGSIVYAENKNNTKDEELILSVCDEIDEILLELNKINDKMCDIQNIQICPLCKKKISADFIYCSKCGNKLQNEEEAGDEKNGENNAQDTKKTDTDI